MRSGCDINNEALDRHRLDQKLCSPLPSLTLRDNADADAKATDARSRQGLRVSPPFLFDWAAFARCRRQTASKSQAILFSLLPQMHFPIASTRISGRSKPTPDRKTAGRSDEQCPSSMLRLLADAPPWRQFGDRRLFEACAPDRTHCTKNSEANRVETYAGALSPD